MKAAGLRSALGRPQILLAEDDCDYRALVADALMLDGYDVVPAATGAEAMDYIDLAFTDPIELGFPSVVVTDIRMPEGSGLDLLAYAGFIPTVVMTAFGCPRTHEAARKLGARQVFDKPFDLGELRAAVRELVNERLTHLPHLRVLIADDDRDFVDYLRDLLITPGAGTVVTAYSGVEVLEALAHHGPFDLVLTDHRMPGPSGVQLVTMARYAGYTGPILIVTAFPGSEVEQAADRHERVLLIPKSARSEDIIGAVVRLLH